MLLSNHVAVPLEGGPHCGVICSWVRKARLKWSAFLLTQLHGWTWFDGGSLFSANRREYWISLDLIGSPPLVPPRPLATEFRHLFVVFEGSNRWCLFWLDHLQSTWFSSSSGSIFPLPKGGHPVDCVSLCKYSSARTKQRKQMDFNLICFTYTVWIHRAVITIPHERKKFQEIQRWENRFGLRSAPFAKITFYFYWCLAFLPFLIFFLLCKVGNEKEMLSVLCGNPCFHLHARIACFISTWVSWFSSRII